MLQVGWRGAQVTPPGSPAPQARPVRSGRGCLGKIVSLLAAVGSAGRGERRVGGQGGLSAQQTGRACSEALALPALPAWPSLQVVRMVNEVAAELGPTQVGAAPAGRKLRATMPLAASVLAKWLLAPVGSLQPPPSL